MFIPFHPVIKLPGIYAKEIIQEVTKTIQDVHYNIVYSNKKLVKT